MDLKKEIKKLVKQLEKEEEKDLAEFKQTGDSYYLGKAHAKGLILSNLRHWK